MKIVTYFKESYSELVQIVTWPSINQLSHSAVIVKVASLLLALVVLAMDLTFENIMKAIYSILY